MIISSNLFQNKQDLERGLKNDEAYVHFSEACGLDTVKNTHTDTHTHIKYSVIYYDLTFKKKTTKCIFVEC